MRIALPAVLAGAFLVGSCTPSTQPTSGGGGGGGSVEIPDHLTITVQPTLVDLGAIMAPALKVQVRTSGNSLVDSSAVDSITVSITPGSGSIGGQTVLGTTTRPVVGGTATFSDLTFTDEGTGFKLTFAATTAIGITEAISDSFNVTNNSSYLYFSSNRTGSFEVWKMRDDGTQQTQVTTRAMVGDPTPAKNPANGRIAFSDGPTGIQSLYTMDALGGSIRQVQTRSDAGEASWSPTSNTIAARVAAGAPSFGLFRVNGDGTNRQQLGGGVMDYPSWSPDGSQISFTLNYTDLKKMGGAGGGDADVVRSDTTDGGVGIMRTAVNDSFPGFISDTGFVPFAYGSTFVLQSAWSPDGMRIAFAMQVAGKSHIFAISNLGAGVIAALTNKSSSNDLAPSWSPDGTKIYFQSDRSGTMQIWSMNADGTGLVQLTSTGQSFSPSWWN